MKKNRKNHHAGRIISLFIVLCMVLAIAPITAFAATDQEITLVDFGNVWKNLDSTKPVAFTTELNPNTDCPNQMEITDQEWIENESGASISSNAYPETGKKYLYEITLTAKEGYFSRTGRVLLALHFLTVQLLSMELKKLAMELAKTTNRTILPLP